MLTMLVSFPIHTCLATPVGPPYHPGLGMEPVAIESPHEVLLKELCSFSTDIQQLSISPDGGNFTLGSGDVSLEIPPGTLKKETSVRFGIMLHGPFVFPPGTEPGSVVVYMNIGTASLMKPVCLSLSHWCSREEEGDNTLKFLRAPHVPEAGNKYVFEELEGGDFATLAHVGMLSIPEPQCLYCVEMKAEKVARYNALTFQKCRHVLFPSLYFRIQLTCHSKEWNKVCVCDNARVSVSLFV